LFRVSQSIRVIGAFNYSNNACLLRSVQYTRSAITSNGFEVLPYTESGPRILTFKHRVRHFQLHFGHGHYVLLDCFFTVTQKVKTA